MFNVGALNKIGRNEKCPCGSGQKFKKCCLGKESSEIISYEITTEPMPELNSDENMSFSDNEIYEALGESLYYRDDSVDYLKAIEILLPLKMKYPHAKRIYNLLATCYEQSDQPDKAEAMVFETYEMFPDYLFAKTGYVALKMKEGDYTKFEEAFSGCYDLQSLYPDRKKFHASEAFAFFTICVKHFAHMGEVSTAERYLDMCRELKPDDPQLEHLEMEIVFSSLEKEMGSVKGRERLENLFLGM